VGLRLYLKVDLFMVAGVVWHGSADLRLN